MTVERLDVPCTACEERTLVVWHPDTYIDPGCPDRDTCWDCGEHLDFGKADPADGIDPRTL